MAQSGQGRGRERRFMTARAAHGFESGQGTHVAPREQNERGIRMVSKKVRAYRDPHVESVARGLGWFSVGLGIAQIVAPRAVCRIVGLPLAPTMMRLCGLRELACGIGIITQ